MRCILASRLTARPHRTSTRPHRSDTRAFAAGLHRHPSEASAASGDFRRGSVGALQSSGLVEKDDNLAEPDVYTRFARLVLPAAALLTCDSEQPRDFDR